MTPLKKIAALAVILIGIFSFAKIETSAPELSFKLENLNVLEMLSNQEFECRPSSEFMFYVESELVKKSRGSNSINASIYVLDRASGQSKLLANENIVVPTHKDAIIHFDTTKSNCDKVVLKNGDKIVGSTLYAPYCFKELIGFENIYNSYVRSTQKLLKNKRAL